MSAEWGYSTENGKQKKRNSRDLVDAEGRGETVVMCYVARYWSQRLVRPMLLVNKKRAAAKHTFFINIDANCFSAKHE
jgi:hypothetical protein